MRRDREEGAERLDAREAHAEGRRQQAVADRNRAGDGDPRRDEVFRYLAATPTAAFLTRMTKISTGHASPTAGAASAMLLILLIQVIGDSVTRRYLLDVTAGVTIGAFVGMSDATTLPTAPTRRRLFVRHRRDPPTRRHESSLLLL